jgi:hypothetical protein
MSGLTTFIATTFNAGVINGTFAYAGAAFGSLPFLMESQYANNVDASDTSSAMTKSFKKFTRCLPPAVIFGFVASYANRYAHPKMQTVIACMGILATFNLLMDGPNFKRMFMEYVRSFHTTHALPPKPIS